MEGVMPGVLGAVRPFDVTVLIKATQETPEGDWLVSGPVASLLEDYDGDTLEKSGIWRGLDVFFRLGGHVDIEHLYQKSVNENRPDLDLIVGKALKGTEVDGVRWLVVKLFKGNPYAQKIWQKLQDGMALGFSLSGFALRKAKDNPRRVLETVINMMTISPLAKGFEQVRLHLGD